MLHRLRETKKLKYYRFFDQALAEKITQSPEADGFLVLT